MRGLFSPTLLAYGREDQKRRFLPKIQSVEEMWCQGYSEPNAGSDLSNVTTHAELDGDEWVITGQKVWTTFAHRAQWCFAVVRTDPESTGHKGLSYLLVPMDQPGIEVRPLKQMTGTAEFNEVFFDEARTAKENVVGEVGEGWKVAMATLGFERGTAFLSQQLAFQNEARRADRDCAAQRHRIGRDDPSGACRLVRRRAGHEVQRHAHADRPREERRARPVEQHRQVVLEQLAPHAR